MKLPLGPLLKVGQLEERFLRRTPWLDVRAPVEYSEGHIPNATNLPLLDNEQRHQIGIIYKAQGKEAAIRLGRQLVSGPVRDQREQGWLAQVAQWPETVIYCFRGGLRSQTTQAWLAARGREVPLVAGGYRTLRGFLRDILERRILSVRFEVVSGLTGVGKTDFLHTSGRKFIDLEGLAKHRGSAFGGTHEVQPNQVNFENALAVELLPLLACQEPILIEKESRLIGRCVVPPRLYEKIQDSPQYRIELALGDRVENIHRDYVRAPLAAGQSAAEVFANFRRSVQAIARKLGGARTTEILGDLAQAEREYLMNRSLESHRIWIEKLLSWYYDPLYAHSQKRLSERPPVR